MSQPAHTRGLVPSRLARHPIGLKGLGNSTAGGFRFRWTAAPNANAKELLLPTREIASWGLDLESDADALPVVYLYLDWAGLRLSRRRASTTFRIEEGKVLGSTGR